MKKIALILIPLVFILAACGSNASIHPASQTVLDYLQAKIDSDVEKIKGLLCSAKESESNKEAASFASVEATLDNPECTFDSANNTVSCIGSISITYNGENNTRTIPKFSVVEEDGEWRVCGEAE